MNIKQIDENLNKSDTFCILPFVHFMIEANGDVRACCLSNYCEESVYGNINENNFESLYNNEKIKNVRKLMLNNERVNFCSNCYTRERATGESHRTLYNKSFKHLFMDIVLALNDDYSLNENLIQYLDIRFSNLCNFKCRYCSSFNSTAWIKDYNKIHNLKYKLNVINYDKIIEIVDKNNIHEYYIAGGEPFYDKNVIKFLNHLIDKQYKCFITFNTNCSNIDFNLLEKLKSNNIKFTLLISLDDIGERAEYIRKNTVWGKIIDNLIMLNQYNFDYIIVNTVGILNIYNLKNFLNFFISNNFINKKNFITANLLIYPEHYSIQALPSLEKEKIRKELFQYLKDISNIDYDLYCRIKAIIDNVISYMFLENKSKLLDEFVGITKSLDKIRKENILNVIPELKYLFI